MNPTINAPPALPHGSMKAGLQQVPEKVNGRENKP